jgi:UTP--glucose-1-phosphate uridylyltransferase
MIKKAVIPAAGFGTRFLPATKCQPKEMLPIVDKPTIQYVVEEAVESGITDILMIIGKSKRAIEEHFDRNFELESLLEGKNKINELEQIRSLSELANIHFVWQREMNGLGDAIRYAKDHVNNEPFVVLLGDTLIECIEGPVTRKMMDIYKRYEHPVVALEEVKPSLVNRYGIINGKTITDDIYLINDFIEKPAVDKAPSNLAIASRYVLTPDVFDYLEKIQAGVNNEIQLTDALRLMVRDKAIYGYKFPGRRHDIGSKIDFLKTNVLYGLKRDDLGAEFKQWLFDLVNSLSDNK